MNIKEEAAPNVHRKVINLFKDKRRGKVLDIAAGHGNISRKLHDMGFRVTAADLEPDKFGVKEVKCYSADANLTLPFENDSFDYVVSVETVEHLKSPFHFINEVHRILKPDGKFILTTPNVETIQSRLLFMFTGDLKYFQPENIKGGHVFPLFPWQIQLLIKEKFKIEKKFYSGGELIPLLPRIGIRIHPFLGIKPNLFGDIIIMEMEKL